MIFEQFFKAYKKDKKLMLDLYKEIKGYEKNDLSKDELKALHEETFQKLKELLNNEDVNSALVKFFSKINQYKYAGLSIDFKFLIFSNAAKYGKKNSEILKKYIKSKDNEKVARIINYLGIIVDITYLEENKLPDVYNIELKEPLKPNEANVGITNKTDVGSKSATDYNISELAKLAYSCIAGVFIGATAGYIIGKITCRATFSSIGSCITGKIIFGSIGGFVIGAISSLYMYKKYHKKRKPF